MSSPRLEVGHLALVTAVAAVLSATLSSTTMAQSQLVLEEVIVTAQKRSESVQDIAATVNVVSAESLDDYNTLTFKDLETQTAGLTLATPNARSSSIAMRGVGTDPEAGASGAVDVYLNGTNVRADIAFSALYDLQRLEVLRGPQGTLQGRASPGGSINIITNEANLSEVEGSIEATLSDNEGINTQFAYSVPLVEDVLAIRVAAVYDTNNASDVANVTSGPKEPESSTDSTRVSINWAPGDNFSAKFIWQSLDRRVDDTKAVVGTDNLGVRPTLASSDEIGLGKFANYAELKFDTYNLTMDWEMAGHDITFLYGRQESDKLSFTENDRAHYVLNPAALTHQSANTIVESDLVELRIASFENDFWDYMVGFYWQDQPTVTEFNANTSIIGSAPFPFGGVSFSSVGAIPVESETTGVFTYNKFQVSDVLSIEAGLRWSNFKSFRRADVFFGEYNYMPDPSFEYLLDIFLNEATYPINGISDKNESSEDDAITGNLTIRYEYSDDLSTYVSYNRGFRRGGISIIPDPDVAFLPDGEDTLIYDNESSNSFEFGFKSRLLDGRAQLNGALYYQKFDGYFGFARGVQVIADSGRSEGFPVDISGGLLYNGDATIWGVELEGQMLVSERLRIGGSMNYNQGEWDSAAAPCNVRAEGERLGFCDVSGEAVGGEPELSISLNAEYSIAFDNSEWYLRGLWKYTDERQNLDASAGIGAVSETLDSTNVANLYTGLRAQDNSWDISFWVKNLFDEDAVNFHTSSDQYDLQNSGGSYTQTNIMNERAMGVTARHSF